MLLAFCTLILHLVAPHFSFPQGAATEQITLRWLHFIGGIIWIGLLYFFNLVGFPTMKQLDASVRGRVFPILMTRAMWWFRWSALVAGRGGVRHFKVLFPPAARKDAQPSRAPPRPPRGAPSLAAPRR